MAWGTGTTAADASAYEGSSAGMGGGPREDNIGFYLDDAVRESKPTPRVDKPIKGLLEAVKVGRPGGMPTVQVVPGAQEFFGGSKRVTKFDPTLSNPYTDDPTKQGSYVSVGEYQPGYFDKLQAEHPSFRVPSPGGPVRRTTFAGNKGEMFGFPEPVTAIAGTYDEETAGSFNDWLKDNPRFAKHFSPVKPGDQMRNPYSRTLSPSGNIGLTITGVSGGNYKPGEVLPQNFLPDDTGGRYFGIASPSGNRKDLIKLQKGSGQNILDHENMHAAMRVLVGNSPAWVGKIDFKGQDLASVLFDKQKNKWDDDAMHIGIYAVNNNQVPQRFWDHPVLKDINNKKGYTDDQKHAMMLARGKALGHKFNQAAGLVLSGSVSQQNPDDWYSILGQPWATGPDI